MLMSSSINYCLIPIQSMLDYEKFKDLRVTRTPIKYLRLVG